ncbi:MAG: hypothetical protein AB1630_12515, partial [bacterium]
AINTGKIVTIPQREIQYYDWEGIGYTIIDPNTGAGAYMISGGMKGGGAADLYDFLEKTLSDELLKSAAEKLNIPLFKYWSVILSIADYLCGIFDILINPDFSLKNKEAMLYLSMLTLMFIASLVSPILAIIIPLTGFVLLILLLSITNNKQIDNLNDWACYKEERLSHLLKIFSWNLIEDLFTNQLNLIYKEALEEKVA